LTPREGVLAEYLLAAMETVHLAEVGRDGPIPALNQQIVGELTIPIPPLDEQRKIANVVSALAAEVVLNAIRTLA
jgi:restriction endonuclease S subunit